MNPTSSLRRLALACCGLILITLFGCSHWIEMASPPTDANEQPPQLIARDEQVPLILDRIHSSRNGAPQNSSAETEQRILSSLADVGLFSHLASANSATEAVGKTVRAKLRVDEAIDPHAGGAALKGIVIGASMYLLTPFLPLEYDYSAHLTLELERWDGEIKRYESQAAGTARYHLFGATPIVIDELKGHVTETCLTELARQIVKDTRFFYASSAPLFEPSIHTVSVKSRASSSAASAAPAITVVTPARMAP